MSRKRREFIERREIAMLPQLKRIGLSIAFCGILVLAACGPAEVARGISDPFEQRNRATHEFNKSIDKALLRPASSGYGQVVPQPVKKGIGNVASNLALPGTVVNAVLQANIDDALTNTFRFLVNSVFGIAGLLDPATDMGIHARPSDFGETLHVWGFSEGDYVEIPSIGPSTERDRGGKVVDLFTNPLSYALDKPERLVIPATGALSRIGERDEYGDLVDSILYESADSYAQARLLYLENRRFVLGGGSTADDGTDPYEDPDGIDPYAD